MTQTDMPACPRLRKAGRCPRRREKRMTTAQTVIYLCRCAVDCVSPVIDDSWDLDAIYKLASRHSVAAMVGMALGDAGGERFKQAVAAAQRRAVIFEEERKKVAHGLDRAGIWYVFLKGSVIKDYYPRFGMREMADVDILFDPSRAADVRGIMTDLGFTCECFGKGAHDIYKKPPVNNFEMHTCLIAAQPFRGYFADIKERLNRKSGCEYEMRPEDFYIYFVAHEYKHYAGGGTGIRSVIDTWVILKRLAPDPALAAAECERLGIAEFEAKNRQLAVHLFETGALTPDEQEMLSYIFRSGTYGTLQHSVENGIEKNGGKTGYVLRRVFLPMSTVESVFPFFYRHKVLLPVLPVYRVVKSLRRGGKAISEIRAVGRA